jgi:hypothetical protein
VPADLLRSDQFVPLVRSKAAMRFQLVLQFAADTIADYDALMAMEHQLIDTLGDGFDRKPPLRST